MTEIETKDWLSRGRLLDREINALLRTKAEAWARLTDGTRAADGVSVQATRDVHRFERYAALEELIDAKIDALVDTQREIVAAVALVGDSALRTLLLERYTAFRTWEQIADDMGYSFRRVMQLHPAALAALGDVLAARKAG